MNLISAISIGFILGNGMIFAAKSLPDVMQASGGVLIGFVIGITLGAWLAVPSNDRDDPAAMNTGQRETKAK